MNNIQEEVKTFLQRSDISQGLFEMKRSARTEDETETVNRLWIQHMNQKLKSETEEMIRRRRAVTRSEAEDHHHLTIQGRRDQVE